jgi:hypothetical protein
MWLEVIHPYENGFGVRRIAFSGITVPCVGTQLLLGMEAQVVFFVFNFVARTAALPNSSGVA